MSVAALTASMEVAAFSEVTKTVIKIETETRLRVEFYLWWGADSGRWWRLMGWRMIDKDAKSERSYRRWSMLMEFFPHRLGSEVLGRALTNRAVD